MNPKWRKTRSGVSTVVFSMMRGTVEIDRLPELSEHEVVWEATVSAPFHAQRGRLEFGPGWSPVTRARVRMEIGPGVAVRFDGFEGTARLDGEARAVNGGILDWAYVRS